MNNMGVNKEKVFKNSRNKIVRKKKRVSNNLFSKLPGMITFLTSDSYFYSHLFGSSSSSSTVCAHKSGEDLRRNEPLLRNSESELKEKLVNYLKADTYLYAPLEDVGYRDHMLVTNTSSSPREQELQFTRITSTVLSKKIAWQTKQLAQDTVVDKQRGRSKSKGGSPDVGIISPRTPAIPNGKIRRRT